MSSFYTMHTGIVLSLTYDIDREEHEVALVLKYGVHPGCEATLEQPGEGPSVSIHDAAITTIGGTGRQSYPAPDWLWPFLESDARLHAEMLAHAATTDEYARERFAEDRRDALRTVESDRG